MTLNSPRSATDHWIGIRKIGDTGKKAGRQVVEGR